MKKWFLVVTMGLLCLMGARAQEAAKEEAAEEAPDITLTGEVVEVSCYLKDERGDDHSECISNAENGLPVAFVAMEADDKEVMYQVLFEDGTAPIDILIDFVGTEVDITGKIVEKAGTKFIIASDVVGGDDWLDSPVGSASTQ